MSQTLTKVEQIYLLARQELSDAELIDLMCMFMSTFDITEFKVNPDPGEEPTMPTGVIG